MNTSLAIFPIVLLVCTLVYVLCFQIPRIISSLSRRIRALEAEMAEVNPDGNTALALWIHENCVHYPVSERYDVIMNHLHRAEQEEKSS